MAALHPQVVHVTIILTIIGVAFRLVSLVDRRWFVGPAACALLLLAAASSVASVQSGVAAHGPVERAPGARPAVMEHEEWGERTQAILIVLGVIELAGLALRRWPKVMVVNGLSAMVGLGAVFAVYETGKHGGELVYAYAGGVGLRSGDPKDVERLLLAGYYHQAMADRAAGRTAQAIELIDAAAGRFRSDPEVQMLAAESQLVDRKNPQAAIDALIRLQLPAGNRFMAFQRATLLADAYEAAGRKGDALLALEGVLNEFPNPRLRQRADALKSTP